MCNLAAALGARVALALPLPAAMRSHLLFSLLVVTSITSCGPSGNGDDVNCSGGKCDGDGNFIDPYKDVGDIETRDFEYIVVGSGAGGGPLAANLARQGHSVLLLEAGKETGGKTEYSVPVLHPTATETPDLAWWYFVDHYSDKTRAQQDTKITPEGILYPRGGALGGSTAVNAMITVAPKNSDWDGIAGLTGDASWDAGNMSQYYDRVLRWLSTERQDVNVPVHIARRVAAALPDCNARFLPGRGHSVGVPHVDEVMRCIVDAA